MGAGKGVDRRCRAGRTETDRNVVRGLMKRTLDLPTRALLLSSIVVYKTRLWESGGGLHPQRTYRTQPAAPCVCCPLPRLSGYGGCPLLWPLLLPPRPEPPLPDNDAHPDRCPGFHGRSHLVGVSGICYEVSTLSV